MNSAVFPLDLFRNSGSHFFLFYFVEIFSIVHYATQKSVAPRIFTPVRFDPSRESSPRIIITQEWFSPQKYFLVVIRRCLTYSEEESEFSVHIKYYFRLVKQIPTPGILTR